MHDIGVWKGEGCIYRVHKVAVNDETILFQKKIRDDFCTGDCCMHRAAAWRCDVQEAVFFGSKAEARAEQVASRLSISHGVGDERMACRASVTNRLLGSLSASEGTATV
jgi:hypothetical protein